MHQGTAAAWKQTARHTLVRGALHATTAKKSLLRPICRRTAENHVIDPTTPVSALRNLPIRMQASRTCAFVRAREGKHSAVRHVRAPGHAMDFNIAFALCSIMPTRVANACLYCSPILGALHAKQCLCLRLVYVSAEKY